MTKKPPARLSRPPTPPGSPAPAHGDGPTGPSAPTGHTEPTDPLSVPCAACLAPAGEGCYSVSSDEPRPAPHRLRSLAAAQHLRRCPMCAAVGWVSADEPTGDLRDRLREALIATALRQAREKGIKLSTFATATIRANAEALADAVLPVVETALTRASASCCGDGDRTYAEMERHLTRRAEEAERQRGKARLLARQMTASLNVACDQRDEQHERAERAEAAVQRVREMVTHEIRTGNGASAYTLRRILNALDAEQPKETP